MSAWAEMPTRPPRIAHHGRVVFARRGAHGEARASVERNSVTGRRDWPMSISVDWALRCSLDADITSSRATHSAAHEHGADGADNMTNEQISTRAAADAARAYDMDAEMAAGFLRNVESGLAAELVEMSNSAARSSAMVELKIARAGARAFIAAYNASWLAETARLAAAAVQS